MATKDKKIGKQTVKLENPPKIISTYSIVGPKEGDGPLRKYFHKIISDDTLGKDSFEKAESEMMYTAIREAIKGANLTEDKIDYLFAGDLLNQITSSSFAARELNIPFIGLPIDVKNVDVIGCIKFIHMKNKKMRKNSTANW